MAERRRGVPDRDATRVVEDLLGVDPARRDDGWLRAFHGVAADAALVSGDPQLIQGPDGFGYFALHLPPSDAVDEPYTVRHVLEPCTVGGFGCVIHDRDGEPAWVFPYGQLWSLRTEGRFDTRAAGDDAGRVLVPPGEEVHVGAPSEEVLPEWARTVLRIALGHLGLSVPRAAVVVRPGASPERALVVGPLGDLPDQARQHLVWYLPGHLGLAFFDDESHAWAPAAEPL